MATVLPLIPAVGVPHPCSASSDRLKPFTSYQFRVKATNDIGDSEYSEESEAITTLQDGEEWMSGVEVQIRLHNSGSGEKASHRKAFSSWLLFFLPVSG